MLAAAVVFVWVGAGNGRVDHQVEQVMHDVHAERATLPASAVRTLARHGETSRDIVKRLHASGVIGGELVAKAGHLTLHLAIYDGDGHLKSMSEVPMAGRTLTGDELDVLRSNLEDEVGALRPAEEPAVDPEPAPLPPAPAIKAPPLPAIKAPPLPKATVVQVKAEPAKLPIKTAKAAPPAVEADIEIDPPATQPAPEPTHAAAPVETADATDAVSVDEIMGATAGDGGGGGEASSAEAPTLHLGAALGFGITGRAFMPGPATMPGYMSSVVGAVRFDAHVQPTERTNLAVVAERTLEMTTPLSDGMAPTTLSRWEAAGSYALVHGGRFEVAPEIGMGRRSFSIASTDPSRSPDADYNYLIVGATAALALGSHVTVRGAAAFEPVVSGVEPTEMAYGEARRWGLDVGASIEARPREHVFVRAGGGYQFFTWTWDDAGVRGAGGALDGYPSGTLSVGADY